MEAARHATLHQAAWNNTAEVAKLLINAGADVNATNGNGETPLHSAAQKSAAETAKVLLAKGAEVNAKANGGKTPLHYAAAFNAVAIVKLLLANGADINAKNSAGYTPLHWAAQNDAPEVAKLLLASGADANVEVASGDILLAWALTGKHPEITKMLIEGGADVNVKVASGDTLLAWALKEQQPETAKLLIGAGADVNVKVASGDTLLAWALKEQQPEAMKLLLVNGADINAKIKGGITPLHWATRENKPKIAKSLIANGADINAKTKDGVTPLHWAAEKAADMVKLLIANGADINVKSKSGITPLHYAAYFNAPGAVKLLIASGADINAKRMDGNTALILAVQENAAEVAKLLIEKGADVNVKVASGDTLLVWALKEKQPEIAQLLIDAGANNDPKTLHMAAHHGNLMFVRQFLSEGANIESRAGPWDYAWGYISSEFKLQDMGVFRSAKSYGWSQSDPTYAVFYYGFSMPYWVRSKVESDGRIVGVGIPAKEAQGQQGTPLHWAARGNAPDVIAFLLEHGANLEPLTKSLQTPLHWAARVDASDAIAELISHGANIEARSKPWVLRVIGRSFGGDWDDLDGAYTPLHMAVQAKAAKAVSVFLENSANPEARDNRGNTPLHSAILNDNREIAVALVKYGADLHAVNKAGKTPLEMAASGDDFAFVDALQKAAKQGRKIPQEKLKEEFTTANTEAGGVFEAIWRSVVVVEAGNSQGSGVALKPNLVATNCHVTDAATSPIAVYKGENRRADKSKSYPARVIARGRQRDVCLLAVEGLWATSVETRNAAEMKIAEQVYAVGAPRGLDFSISGGLVSQLREEEGSASPLIQTDTAISPGSSGGGLFDAKGKLVGLTTFGYRDSEGLNFAVPIEWALELIPDAEQ